MILAWHDHPRIHLAKAHPHQTRETDVRIGHERLKPHLAVNGDEDEQHQTINMATMITGIDDKHPPFEFRALCG